MEWFGLGVQQQPILFWEGQARRVTFFNNASL
jgi:hypothetical protein